MKKLLEEQGIAVHKAIESLFYKGGTIDEDFIIIGDEKIGLSTIKKEDVKMIKLFERMGEIVEDTMKSYQSDFYKYDIHTLKNAKEGEIYYWYVRDSGTELMRADRVCIIGSFENTSVKYWYSRAIKTYKITITKNGGEIERINKRSLLSHIEKNEIDYKAIIADVTLEGGELLEKFKIPKEKEDQCGGIAYAIAHMLREGGRYNATRNTIEKISIVKYIA